MDSASRAAWPSSSPAARAAAAALARAAAGLPGARGEGGEGRRFHGSRDAKATSATWPEAVARLEARRRLTRRPWWR